MICEKGVFATSSNKCSFCRVSWENVLKTGGAVTFVTVHLAAIPNRKLSYRNYVMMKYAFSGLHLQLKGTQD